MPARRFFVEGVHQPGTPVEIGGSDARKIIRVLRLRDGDAIEVVDSSGALFQASVTIDGRVVTALLSATMKRDEEAASRCRIDVAQALPKGRKMDLVIEKTTELGAGAILPFHSERSIARDPGAAKLERWRRIAKSAAAQCGRVSVPDVHAIVPSFESLSARFSRYDSVLVAWELATREPLRERLPALLAGARRILIVVGPEGGFTHDEAEVAVSRGAALVWLGQRILRTETAALAMLAIVDALVP